MIDKPIIGDRQANNAKFEVIDKKIMGDRQTNNMHYQDAVFEMPCNHRPILS